MKRKIPGYLNTEEIHKGIILCIENARDLLRDCKLLRRRRRYARVMSLSISAIEEIGKISLLRTINRIPKNKQKLHSIEWKNFYNHNFKSSLGFANTLPDHVRSSFDEVMFASAELFANAPLSENARQFALYTDYIADRKKWTSPRYVNRQLSNYYYSEVSSALKRILSLQKYGIFDIGVLEIEKETYEELYNSIPDREIDGETLSQMKSLSIEKARDFFDRLVDAGKISRRKLTFLPDLLNW